MTEEDKYGNKGKFTIPVLMPVILFIAMVIQLFLAGSSFSYILSLPGDLESLSPEAQVLMTNALLTAAATFVGVVLLYVFLWGVLYYLYKATGNKLFSISSETAKT